MSGLPIAHVDAFADGLFEGNPAAVCLLDGPRAADWMLRVAIEMNLAETAFVHLERQTPEGTHFGLRWFGRSGEVDLCGHATLAAAHILWERGMLKADEPARFETRSGPLVATRTGDLIELDFPSDPVVPMSAANLAAALGAPPTFVGRGRFYALAAFRDEAAVRALAPDFVTLAAAVADGVVCTAPSGDPRFDVFSRYFGPSLGNPEDTVTGSSACLLAPFWSARLGRTQFLARQEHGETGRGGTIQVTARGDRVGIGGRAVTVLDGWLRSE